MNARLWFPLLLGAAIGIVLGLYFAWVVSPVEFVDTAPNTLRTDYKEDYLRLIALDYAASQDLVRAQTRLGLLEDPDVAARIEALAEVSGRNGEAENRTRALAQLASALGGGAAAAGGVNLGTGLEAQAGTPSPTPGLSSTASPTAAPPPATHTPTATPGAPFTLIEQIEVCDANLASVLIQVHVEDAAGSPVSGVEVFVVWDEGQDRFLTGLKPELGIGYGDFSMEQDVVYAVQLAQGESLISGLAAPNCESETGSVFPGSWLLRFTQPLGK